MAEILRLHQFLPVSHANGPGRRAALWVQGCTLNCPGCFNPQTHSTEGGRLVSVDDLFQNIVALGDSIEGISVSGGEPLQQIWPLLALLKRVRAETNLSILLFSGYEPHEIKRFPAWGELAACVDVLIAGRYDRTRPLRSGLISSANQTPLFLSERYTLADLESVPPAEVILTPDGEIVASGVGGINWEERAI
jgi:anaerobic ribonucleoside-triphosphate reductase activating protein